MFVMLVDDTVGRQKTQGWVLCMYCNECDEYDEAEIDSDEMPLDQAVHLAFRVRGWTHDSGPNGRDENCWCPKCSEQRKAA
jgi:hypothetical protein